MMEVTMAPDFYLFLSNLLDKIALAPHNTHVFPVDEWPVGSQERQLLESLQSLLLTWQHQERVALLQSEKQEQELMEARRSEQAAALENIRNYEEAQRIAVAEERQRLAQNLHDAVNQSLFSAGLIAEVLPRLWKQDPVQGQQSLEDLRRLTRGALAEMRGLLIELRPVVLTDTELSDLLYQLSNAFTGRTNVPVTVTIEGNGTLPAEVQVVLYRVCQEGLSNIAKHARAEQVTIKLRLENGVVELHLLDDGGGFNPENIPSGHFGLSMMQERATAVGAALTIASEPGHGSTITFFWETPAELET